MHKSSCNGRDSINQSDNKKIINRRIINISGKEHKDCEILCDVLYIAREKHNKLQN